MLDIIHTFIRLDIYMWIFFFFILNNGSFSLFLLFFWCILGLIDFQSYCVGFRNGYEPELPPVSTGSHTDAIPYSGKYDGVVGVLGAIEAINVLKR